MKLFQRLVAACALAAPSLFAATPPSQTLRVHIPFVFFVAGKQFAPGDYVVQQNDNGLLMIQGGGHAVLTLSVPTGGGRADGSPRLRFVTSQERQYLVGVEGETTRAIPMPSERLSTSPLAR